MAPLRPLVLLLLLQACGDSPASSAEQPRPAPSAIAEPAAPPPAPRAATRPAAPAQGESATAARAARVYFDRIEAGDFAGAWALRWESKDKPAAAAVAFASSFAGYRAYRATIGAPSAAVRAGDSHFVEVPVQIYGERADGKPFGSAGTITLRRADGGAGGWRLYTR